MGSRRLLAACLPAAFRISSKSSSIVFLFEKSMFSSDGVFIARFFPDSSERALLSEEVSLLSLFLFVIIFLIQLADLEKEQSYSKRGTKGHSFVRRTYAGSV